jgi:hypothetical protein
MKKAKVILSAFAVLAIVSSALAFKSKTTGQGSLYCERTCINLIDFAEAASGTAVPCGVGNPVFKFAGTNCVQSTSLHFIETDPGK